MKTLIVDQKQVEELLPMPACIEVMRDAFTALANGQATMPLRTFMWLPDKSGLLASMPSHLASINAIGLKAITVFPGNEGTEFDSHIGVVLLYGAKHGELLAIMDATSITAIRTAAVSGLATSLLARTDAGDLAILGSGTQARTHLAAMVAARNIRRVRVYSKNAANASRFAERESKRYGLKIESMSSAQAAVSGADIVCTTTSSREPVLMGEWLSAGAHLNVVGASIPAAREVDTFTVKRSRLYCDKRESLLNEAGDFIFPKKEGAIDDSHIVGELGDLVVGKLPGRASREEITLFKSLGLAIEDLASAQFIYDAAAKQNIGTWVELGGSRHE
jgi:ornithine cyclodeaminase/alanine dehydrogenase-like protein (mu-crystallin family)